MKLSHRYAITAIAAILVILMILISCPSLIDLWRGEASRSEFSSSFELASSLFSGLAFVGVIVAMLMQREELELQRHEITENRHVLDAQRQQLENQANLLALQGFESTFFRLLELHRTNVENISTQVSIGNISTGRTAITWLANELRNWLREASHSAGEQKRQDIVATAFDSFYEKRLSNSMGHYFRTAYVIVKFIDESSVSDKKRYIRIFRAQLSQAELLILFYNCIGQHGNMKFRPLTKQYDLFQNLPSSSLADASDFDLLLLASKTSMLQ